MSAATAGAVSFERWDTKAELWTSFASLLRSYAAAHGLNSRHQAVVEVSAGSVMLRVAGHWTSVVMQQGRVTVDQDWNQQGTIAFREIELQDNGEFAIPAIEGRARERVDMDMFAERLAREIFERAKA
jgi:hypothetical protein